MTDTETSHTDLLALTADIVSAQVASNAVALSEVPALIASVHAALAGLGKEPQVPEPAQATRPIGVRASIKPHGLISMIDGKLYQSLKRHLSRHGLTPASYRERFALPVDYPMVSAAYSEKRRALAKAIGLGATGGKKPAATAPVSKVRKTLKVAIDAAKGHLGG